MTGGNRPSLLMQGVQLVYASALSVGDSEVIFRCASCAGLPSSPACCGDLAQSTVFLNVFVVSDQLLKNLCHYILMLFPVLVKKNMQKNVVAWI